MLPRKGDTVTVKMRAVTDFEDGEMMVASLDNALHTLFCRVKKSDIVNVTPRPIQQGDSAVVDVSGTRVRVLFVDGNEAWVLNPDTGARFSAYVSSLTRI